MGVNISSQVKQPSLRDSNCIFCGRCVEACRNEGKTGQNDFEIARELEKKAINFRLPAQEIKQENILG